MHKFNIQQKKQESSSSNINVLQLSIDIREVNTHNCLRRGARVPYHLG